MTYNAFTEKLGLQNKVLGIQRVENPSHVPEIKEGCTLAALKRAMAGEELYINSTNARCGGSCAGTGLADGIPATPGGFGYFLSAGRGEGYPKGERMKRTPELAEAMMTSQPQNVMGGLDALLVASYKDEQDWDLVTILANPDQLSALVILFNYEKSGYDTVIAPMSSGCASLFRIPLGELERGEEARGVIGNIDVFSRPHFASETFFFTISGSAFRRMLSIAGESVLISPIWKGIEKRLFS